MKTYMIEENYGDMKRITVEDDTVVNINTYEHNHEGSLVKFTKPGINYNDNLIAAFGNVKGVYLEGTNIEKSEREYDAVAKAEPSDFTTKWTTISTPS